MLHKALIVFTGSLCLLCVACNPQERGFNLPPGDANVGKANFVLLQCNECHSVGDVPYVGRKLNVQLGGVSTRVKTYGDLVTSIINPSHKLSRGSDPVTQTETGESVMRNYNETLTVQELIDLVAFLQSEYEVWVPDYYSYPAL
ncbi:MAG: cytochrome C [Pseudomonadota bacterium]